MDNLTHTLFAATLARTPLGRAGRGTTAALVIASNAPDIDIAATVGGAVSYLEWHRGPTHGPLGIIGLAVLTAALVWRARRVLDSRMTTKPAESDAPFGMLVSISFIGVMLHVLMDLPTSYGTRLLSPFDWHWFAFDWLPIVDIYMLVALLAGIFFAEVSKTSRRRISAIVLMLMAANYGIRAVAHHRALVLAPRLFGPLLPPPCDMDATRAAFIESWPRRPVSVPPDPAKPCLVELAAVPTFVSPFRWRVVAHLSNAFQLHEIDVLDARFRRPPVSGEVFWRRAVRYPNPWTPATFAAAATRTARVFLGFSRFPAARPFVDSTGVVTVRWNDMRFVDRVPSSRVRQRPDLFSVLVRIGPDGRVLEEQLGR